MLAFAEAEAHSLIEQNRDIAEAMVAELMGVGELEGSEVDEIISTCISQRLAAAEHERR